MTCGIYCITNGVTGRQYIGQAQDCEDTHALASPTGFEPVLPT